MRVRIFIQEPGIFRCEYASRIYNGHGVGWGRTPQQAERNARWGDLAEHERADTDDELSDPRLVSAFDEWLASDSKRFRYPW